MLLSIWFFLCRWCLLPQCPSPGQAERENQNRTFHLHPRPLPKNEEGNQDQPLHHHQSLLHPRLQPQPLVAQQLEATLQLPLWWLKPKGERLRSLPLNLLFRKQLCQSKSAKQEKLWKRWRVFRLHWLHLLRLEAPVQHRKREGRWREVQAQTQSLHPL